MIDPRVRGYEEKIVQYVNDNVKKLKDARSEREDIWVQCMEAYLSQFNKSWVAEAKAKKRSSRYLALTWDAVENITAQIMAMIMPGKSWFNVEPGRIGGMVALDDTSANNTKYLMQWQHRQMALRSQIVKLVKWLIITGNCPWTMTWHTEKALDYPSYAQAMSRWVQQQKEAFVEYQKAMVEHAVTTRVALQNGIPPPPPPGIEMPDRPVGDESIAYAGPRLIVGDIFNYVQDSQANDDDTAFRAATFWRSKQYLKQYAEVDETGYAVYENLELVQDSERRSDDENEKGRLISSVFGVDIPEKSQTRLVEAGGDHEIQLSDGPDGVSTFKNHIITVANGRTLVRFEEDYLWSRKPHMRLATLIPCPGQSLGIGLVENALGTQDAINARSNQVIDAGAYTIHPEVQYKDNGIYDPLTAEVGPGAHHPVSEVGDIAPIAKDFRGINLAFSEIGMMKGEFQQIMRATNPFTTQQYKKSATEIARDTAVTGGSLQEIARFVEDGALVPLLEMQLQLTQQYMDSNVAIRIVQDGNMQSLNVSPQDIRHAWSIVVNGSQNVVEKQKRIEDLFMFYQLTTGNPETIIYLEVHEFLKRMVDELGIQGAEKILKDPVLVQQQIMQQQMMEAENEEGKAKAGGGSSAAKNSGNGGARGDSGAPPVAEAIEPYTRQTLV